MAAQDSIELDLSQLLGPLEETSTVTTASEPHTHEMGNGAATATTQSQPDFSLAEAVAGHPMLDKLVGHDTQHLLMNTPAPKTIEYAPPTYSGGGIFERLLDAVDRIEQNVLQLHQMVSQMGGPSQPDVPAEVAYPIAQDFPPVEKQVEIPAAEIAAPAVVTRRRRSSKATLAAPEATTGGEAPVATAPETPPAPAQPASLDDLLAEFDL